MDKARALTLFGAMKLFVALSCLQGRPMRAAFEELRALADGVQLTPGNAPTVGFSEWVRSQPASVRTHQGFTPMALRAAVWDDDGNLLGAWDSVHPPSNYGDEWLARPTIKPCIEIMYPGKPLGSGPEIERAMDAALDLAVDVSHIHIQLCSGSLSPRVWRRLQDYERVREVHVSANDGRRDRHQPIDVGAFGLQWAQSRGLSGTPIVFEAYLHALSDDERRRQIEIVRGAHE